MFKEVISLAIILGFILNILYVAHPDTHSYTLAFVASLVFLSPGWGYMLYRRREKKRREKEEMKAMRVVLAEAGGVSGNGNVREGNGEGIERWCCRVGEENRLRWGIDATGSGCDCVSEEGRESDIALNRENSERDLEKGLLDVRKTVAERKEASNT